MDTDGQGITGDGAGGGAGIQSDSPERLRQGGGTGTRYRFDHPGATVVVDPRDRPSLARVPGLRQVTPG